MNVSKASMNVFKPIVGRRACYQLEYLVFVAALAACGECARLLGCQPSALSAENIAKQQMPESLPNPGKAFSCSFK